MDPLALILSLPAICLLAFLVLPSRWVNERTARVRQVVTWLVGLQFALSVIAAMSAQDVNGLDSVIPLSLIGWFLIAAAVLKSAQFPFHGWHRRWRDGNR